MNIYNYQQNTGEFTGASSTWRDPEMPERWVLPAFATFSAPPETGLNEVAVYRDGSWVTEPDFRGAPCWLKSNAKPVFVSDFGPLPDECTTLEPPIFPVWSGDGWESDIAQVAGAKIAEVDSWYKAQQGNLLVYDGVSYFADAWSTKTLESCLVVATALGQADTDPVRVPAPLQHGYWVSADIGPSGDRVIVPMTVGKLKGIITALYDRNGDLWGTGLIHIATIQTMAATGATAEDIMAYQYKAG